jgi:hypothetical protein
MDKPKAHRLADTPFALRDGRWNCDADDELRRLHAVNAELLEALRSIVNLWDHHASAHHDGIIYPLHQAARAAIAKAEGQA